MEKSHLVDLIRVLTPEEKAHLREYAKLSFINDGSRKKHVFPLLEACLNHNWDIPGSNLEKERLYEQLFPGQAFVDGKLEKIMVEAHKIIRTYLVSQHYLREENEFQQNLDFAEIVRTRGMIDRYEHVISKVIKAQQDEPYRHAQHYHRQFILETALHYVDSMNNQRKGDLNIPQVLHATEMYYQCRKVALLSRFLLQQKAAKLITPPYIEEQIQSLVIAEADLQASPMLNINYLIFKLIQQAVPEFEQIKRLDDLLKTHENDLDTETIQEFYAYLRNFWVLLLTQNSDQSEIRQELFRLYSYSLNKGWLHYEGKLAPARYLGLASNALLVGETDWAIQFIERYKNDIYSENETQDIYRLNKAQYLFVTGKFEQSLDLVPAHSTHLDCHLIAKRLEIKVYYELQSDLLGFKLDAFKMFLSRTSPKILPDHERIAHIDFTNLLNQIINSIPGDKKRAQKILERIESNKQAAEWRWLHAKAKELAGI